VAPLALALVVASVDTAWGVIAGAASALLLGLSSLLPPSKGVAQTGVTLGAVASFAVVGLHAHQRHYLILLLALASTALLFAIWQRDLPGVTTRSVPRRPHPLEGVIAAVTCGVASVAVVAHGVWPRVAAVAAVLGLLFTLSSWVRESWTTRDSLLRVRIAMTLLTAATVVAVLATIPLVPPWALAISAFAPLVGAVLSLRSSSSSSGQGLVALLLEHPARLLVVTFAGLCTLGTLGLSWPWCASRGGGIGVLNAAFTSVSATCVTGLVVVDTPTDLSLLGQIFVLLLIQAGGLGIMTISTSALSLLGRRLSLRQEAVMASLVSQENRADVYHALRRTLAVTVVFELVGAFMLAWAFTRAGDGWPRALWHGLFTSISAFCNAGFALQTDSLVPYQDQPIVLHVVSVLIIAGGLSPVAIVAIPRALRGRRLGLQVRVALVSTLVLLVFGFVAMGSLEWGASLEGLSFADRLHNAWFQSVTLRTAGFNSVDFGTLQPATWVVMIVLMFVGGCPGGTAGGLKTTTAFVLLLALVGSLRGRNSADAFGRTIPSPTVFKATAIATMGVLAVALALTMLLIAQPLPFHVALFEVVSALGTVGLSIGGTAHLDEIGKTLIMACMFLGRVGPLTVFLILSDRRVPSPWVLPSEEIEVG
jgi:trk system potassium uptake protein TrkH